MISKRNSRLYIITQFLHSLIFTIPVWIVFYQERLTAQEMSILVAFQYLIQVIGELPTGALADLLGKKITSIIGFLLAALSFLLFPLANSFFHFLILAALVGISDALLSGSVEAMIYDSLKQDNLENQFSKIVSKQAYWYQIGLFTATLLGGFLFNVHYSLPYLTYGLSLVIAFILSFYFIEPEVDSEKFTISNYFKQMKLGSKEAFKNHNITAISLYYVIVGSITWTCALYFNSYMMVDLGFNDQIRGVIQSVLRLGNVLLLSFLISKNFFNDKISIVFFPLIMIASLLPGIYLNSWLGVPFVAGAMMASTARWMILAKYTNYAFESKYRATAISMLSMLIGVLYITITLLSGPIINQFTVKTMYTMLGVLSILTVLPLSIYILKKVNLNF